MKPCDNYRSQIALYLDDELSDQELSAFESHLSACAACRSAVDAERSFLDALHSARPLYTAPPELRIRVEEMLQSLVESPRADGFWLRLRDVMKRTLRAPVKSRGPLLQAAAAIALLLAVLAGSWSVNKVIRRPDPHSEFAAMAVHLHQQRLSGKLRLETHVSSPASISAWFQGRVPFKVDLPSYEELPGRKSPYQIEGARMVSYHGDPAGYIAYSTGGRQVSLVSLPTSVAPPLRGKGVVMGKLTIFYDDLDGFHVITWSGPRSRLTYALVSDLEHPSQACILCHASSSSRDRNLMLNLNRQ